MKLLAAVLVALALTAPAAASPPAVKVTVTPNVGFAPLAIKITVLLGIPVKDRQVCVLLDTTWGDGKTESTCFPWDTEKQGSQNTIHIRNMPEAEYVVQAAVHLGGDKWARSVPVTVSVR